MFTAELGHGHAILSLLQNRQNLAVRKSGRFHAKSPAALFSEILLGNATFFWGDYRTADRNLLDLLLKEVGRGNVICPIGLSTFLEIARQNDPTTLHASAELIDHLSKGVCFKFPEERLGAEILHFFRTKTMGIDNCYPVERMAWTKVFHVFGLMIPHTPSLDEETNHYLQVGYLDHVWNISFSDMVKEVGCEQFYTLFGKERFKLASKLNAGKFTHAEELKSLPQAVMTEIAGFLDTILPQLESIAIHMHEKDMGETASPEEIKECKAGKLFANAIYHYFEHGKIDTELPMIRIESTLHAAMRWDRKRKFKDNDIADIHHASCALPYCDFFLTEKSLASLIMRKDISFDAVYNCKVFSDSTSAIAAISNSILTARNI